MLWSGWWFNYEFSVIFRYLHCASMADKLASVHQNEHSRKNLCRLIPKVIKFAYVELCDNSDFWCINHFIERAIKPNT